MRAGLAVAATVVVVAVGYSVTEAFHPFGSGHLTTVVVVTHPLNQQSVTSAFARVGEPLAVRLDTAADAGSPIVAIYVPANQDVPNPPFELNLFREVATAEAHARTLSEEVGANGEIERAQNAVLIAARTIPAKRRARLRSAMDSLR
jgi:hypothetical protein